MSAATAADAAAVARAQPPRGRFLVLEGIDGCGKTTQLEALRQWLPGSGLMPPGSRLLVSREPGGTALGQALRALLLHPPEAAAPCPTAELLLYAADRAQHVESTILPALEAGDWVLCDRFTGSTAAYQGYGRGLSLALIEQLEAIATAGLRADLTLWLDLPLSLSLQRRQGRAADRIEASGEAFLARVAAGFSQLAERRGWLRLDASAPVPQVTAACRQRIQARLSGVGSSPRPEACGVVAEAPPLPLQLVPDVPTGGLESADGAPPLSLESILEWEPDALQASPEASPGSAVLAIDPSPASPGQGVSGSWGAPEAGA